MRKPRLHPRIVVRRDSRNQSERTGRIQAIVIHSTESHNYEGPRDLAAIGEWFDNPAAQASAHVCTDADGTSARYVPDHRKAWHCASYNSATLGVEQIGQAAQPKWHDREVRETARWVAQWSIAHHVPIRKGAVSAGRVTRTGVLRHSDLGDLGGGHNDPGPNYPFGAMLRWARLFKRLRRNK